MQINNVEGLNRLVGNLETKIPLFEKLDTSISASNIGWHIDHTLMVLIGIIDTTAKSEPSQYKWKFNFKRLVVIFKNKIPRGKAKAPKSVQPNGDYTIESLTNKITIAKSKLKQLKQMPNTKYFEHPGLGPMKLKQTIKFLEIHTRHHVGIIEDIIKSEE